ncbi:hypothetical protein [Sphingopyxis yananensis]|jgi:hypothetical protein|uniref:hypothetical protein n=1 Tax=Sphingopyxis yananensis TaxID=2886687 RepID=UPI001D12CD08|nr:hypothetical protein [Sphingopyxis yananensis]MCC2601559.1 hypothetical protein [Sphingopyxis yananensis]
MMGVLVQAGVSLAAVSGIAWLVKKLKLGLEPRIADEAHALRLAEEAEAGFGGVDVARDRAGYSALVRNGERRMMVIRAHGNHFAARAIDSRVTIRLDKNFLILTVPERRFGPVALQLGKQASVWAARMRDLVPSKGRWRRIEADAADSVEVEGESEGERAA